MTFKTAILGLALGFAAQAAKPPLAMTGCVDQKDGQYVLLDDQMVMVIHLQAPGSEKEIFAKYVGHKVQVRGTKSDGPNAPLKVVSIARVAGECGAAK